MSATSRACWNVDCDRILIEVLFDQRDDGKQTSNGNWHKVAWTAAEMRLAGSEVRSGGGPKSAASCMNRWGALKKDYREVKILLDKSGFGWDAQANMPTAENSVWDDLLRKQPTLGRWRKTQFPCYDELANLIEGTYATGEGVFRPSHNRAQSPSISNSSSSSNNESDDPGSPPNTSISTMSPYIPAHRIQKRQAADTPEPTYGKRPRHEHKKTASQAINDMALSIDRLASVFATDTATSPVRKRSAIQVIEDEESFSTDDQVKVFQLIRRDTTFADAIIAIRQKDARTLFIQRELHNQSPESSEI